MSYTSGFFDALDLGGGKYDREYSAAVFAHYFSLLVKNGVFPDPSTGMQVKASSSPDMHVSVQPGSGWVNGYYITISDDGPEVLTVPTANPSLSRIDSVIMGLNYVDREIQLYIKSGAVSSSPSAVSLQRDNDLYEMELAQIAVGAGVASISQANITDMRQNTSRCGIVKGTIDQIDTTDLFAQYDDAFQTWFDDIQSQLSGDVATNLQNQINSLKTGKVNVSDKASTEQAQAGTDNTKWMTPALVKASLNDYNKKFYKVGDIVVTARTDLGSDWALCNGASFTPSQYPELAGVTGNPSVYKIGDIISLKRTNLAYNDCVVVLDDEGRIVTFNQKGNYNTFTAWTFNKDFGVTNVQTYTVAQMNENRNGSILYDAGYFYFISVGSAYSPQFVIYKFKLDGSYFQRKTVSTIVEKTLNYCIKQSKDYIVVNCHTSGYSGYSYISKNNFESDSIHTVNITQQGKLYSDLSVSGNRIILAGATSRNTPIIYAYGNIGGTLDHRSTILQGDYDLTTEMCSDGTRAIVANGSSYFIVNTGNGAITYERWDAGERDSLYKVGLNFAYHKKNFLVYEDSVFIISMVGQQSEPRIIALNLKQGDGFSLFKHITVVNKIDNLYALESRASLGFFCQDTSNNYTFGYFSNTAIPNIQLNNAFAYIRTKTSN